jgi:1-acyl-sn-glycerol-3-phosphate acyltransferase
VKGIRFLLFNLAAWFFVLLYAPVVIVARILGRHASFVLVQSWARVILFLVRNICGLRFTVVGLDKLPADSSIVFLKHSSAFETLAQLVIFSDQVWVLKRELIWIPFFGWALATLRPIAIDRSKGGAAVRQVLEQGVERLAEGLNVMIFPEGTRMAAGKTRRYGISGTLLAQESGKLIVPVAHNAGYHWPRRGFGITPGEVTFVIGDPVDPQGHEPRQVNERIQAWIEAEVSRIVTADRSAQS